MTSEQNSSLKPKKSKKLVAKHPLGCIFLGISKQLQKSNKPSACCFFLYAKQLTKAVTYKSMIGGVRGSYIILELFFLTQN